MRRTIPSLAVFGFLAFAVSNAQGVSASGARSVAAVSDARTVATAFESRYRNARTLRADFLERYSDGTGVVASESGTVYFARPGRMRWEYESPEEKLFLVDGKNAWFYVPADHVVSRAKIKESSDWRTPLALLAGSANLSSLCRSLTVVKAADAPSGVQGEPSSFDKGENGDNSQILRCLPRSEADSEVFLRVDADSWVVRLLIREPGKIETEFRFGNWEEDAVIPAEKFKFQVPPGASVVDEAALAGTIH